MVLQFECGHEPTEMMRFRFLDDEGKLTRESIKNALKPPYPVKFFLNIVLFIFALTVLLLFNYGIIPGNELGFFCNDPLFSHKYNGETIPPEILGVGIAFLPILIYFTVEYIRRGSFLEMFTLPAIFELYYYAKQFNLGFIIVGGITEIAKTIVGEHRPHFFDVCRPDTNVNCTYGTYIFTFTCTNTDNYTHLNFIDASRSFPSGHSSLSCFTALFCAYIVQTRIPTHKIGSGFKLLLLAVSLTFGLVCSLTRITDRRHHWWDVLIGAIIGIVGAIYSIRVMEKKIRIFKTYISTKNNSPISYRI